VEFANTYLANGGSLDTVKNKLYDSTANPAGAPIMKDLLFVASNWSSPSFDLWEEEEGDHFYTVSAESWRFSIHDFFPCPKRFLSHLLILHYPKDTVLQELIPDYLSPPSQATM